MKVLIMILFMRNNVVITLTACLCGLTSLSTTSMIVKFCVSVAGVQAFGLF